MTHSFSFEGTVSNSIWEDLRNIPESKNIILVERKNGFTEIHSENGIEYTTADILEKNLIKTSYITPE